MIDVLVDGEVFCLQRAGGVSRIFEETLPRLAEIERSIAPTLFLRDRPVNKRCLELGVHTTKVWLPREKGRGYRLRQAVRSVFERFVVPRVKQGIHHDVFLSTYFTVSPHSQTPSIVFVYDMIYERFPELFDPEHHAKVVAQKRKAIERATLVLCISEATRGDVVELIGIPRERCRVVYLSGERFASLGAAPGRFRPSKGVQLLYVGQYGTPYKNFDFLLTALASASDERIRTAKLRVICRNPPPLDVSRRYAEIWPRGTLVFEADCTDEDLAAHYQSCSALVYPSLYEGFGLPPVEAHSLGVPVVCSDIPVFRELGADAYFFFDPASPRALEQAILNALVVGRQPEAVAKRQRHAAQFTWQRTAKGIASAICDVAVT